MLEALPGAPESLTDRDELESLARASATHRRLARVDGAERAPSGKASCRECKQPIARATWRIRLTIYEEGQFTNAGFIHFACRVPYFEGHEVLAALLQFSPGLADEDREDLMKAYQGA